MTQVTQTPPNKCETTYLQSNKFHVLKTITGTVNIYQGLNTPKSILYIYLINAGVVWTRPHHNVEGRIDLTHRELIKWIKDVCSLLRVYVKLIED